MRRRSEKPDKTERTKTVDSPKEPKKPRIEVEGADHPLLGLGLAIETYHRGVT